MMIVFIVLALVAFLGVFTFHWYQEYKSEPIEELPEPEYKIFKGQK